MQILGFGFSRREEYEDFSFIIKSFFKHNDENKSLNKIIILDEC